MTAYKRNWGDFDDLANKKAKIDKSYADIRATLKTLPPGCHPTRHLKHNFDGLNYKDVIEEYLMELNQFLVDKLAWKGLSTTQLCPICHECLGNAKGFHPTALTCGHVYCADCIERLRIPGAAATEQTRKYSCSICREQSDGSIRLFLS